MAVPNIVGTPLRTGFSTTRSPGTGNVATAGTLVAGDIIGVWARAGASTATMTVPANWVNPLGGNTVVASGGTVQAFLYHVVTAAEVTANTVAWTLTNLWDASQTGALYTAAVHNVDQVTIIDAFGSAFSASSANPHVLAGVTNTDVSFSNDLIMSGVGADTTATYATAPAGWTFQAKNAGGQNSGALLSRDTASSAGTAVTATNITPSSGGNYASITVLFSEIQSAGADTTKFFFAQL